MVRRGRKLILPILLAVSLWLVITGIIIWVDPELVRDMPVTGTYGLFFGLVGLAMAMTATLVWQNKRRGVLTAILVVSFLGLRLIKLAYWFNLLLLIGILVAVDSVFTKRD